MSGPERPRVRPATVEGEARLAAWLKRSALLDVAPDGARERVRSAVSRGARSPERVSGKPLAVLIAAGLALAAATTLVARNARTPTANVRAEPTRPLKSAAASASAVSALPACPRLVVAKGDSPLIDDMEDKNARLLIADGRSGYWAVYNDGTGPQTPSNSPLHPQRIDTARGNSHYALHTSGGTFTKWGAVLIAPLAEGACYDASAYAGIEFWAKGNTRILVGLPVVDEVSVEVGGLCKDKCDSGARKPVDLAKSWQHVSLRWEDIAEPGKIATRPFDPKRLVSVAFSIYAPDTPFDIWIDDVRFIAR